MSFIRDCLEKFSFTRLDDLADRVVGKAAVDKRQTIRWPDEIASLKKNVGIDNVVQAVLGACLIAAIISIPVSVLSDAFGGDLFFKLEVVAALLVSVVVLAMTWRSPLSPDWMLGSTKKARRIMEPLLGKDPYIDLRAAAYLTGGPCPSGCGCR